MLSFLFSSIAIDLGYYCQAPDRTPPKLDNYTLKHMTLLLRHGHRTPSHPQLPLQSRGRWECDNDDAPAPRMEAAPSGYYRYYKQVLDETLIDYPPSCRPGDLTVVGQQMHVQLGGKYRKYLVDDLKFLPEKMKPSLFKFYTSPVERTFRSAESFISGFYPPLSDNEVISIIQGTTNSNPINAESCPEFVSTRLEFHSSQIYTDFVDSIWPDVKEAAEFLHLNKSN